MFVCCFRSVRFGYFFFFCLPLPPFPLYRVEPRSTPVAASTSLINSGSCHSDKETIQKRDFRRAEVQQLLYTANSWQLCIFRQSGPYKNWGLGHYNISHPPPKPEVALLVNRTLQKASAVPQVHENAHWQQQCCYLCGTVAAIGEGPLPLRGNDLPLVHLVGRDSVWEPLN